MTEFADLDDFIKQATQAFAGTATDTLDDWLNSDDETDLNIWDDALPSPSNTQTGIKNIPNKVYPDQLKETNPQLAKNLRQLEPGSFSRWTNQFDNGEIADSEMTQIAPGQFLRADAAQAFKAMRRAARKDGVSITITDSYRDYDTQVRLAEEKGLYSEGGLAAEPGTSEHGWGLAIDAASGIEWMAENGAKFGFHDDVPREDWHFDYKADGTYQPTVTAFKGKRRNRKEKPEKTILDVKQLAGRDPGDTLVASLYGVMNDIERDADPNKDKDQSDPGGIKAQLKKGFLEAGRPDLARMVGTEAFNAWIGQESGWNPESVSPANNQGLANGGLFQFWFGHAFTDGYMKNGKFTMSVADQAFTAATQFNLTPERIKSFAAEIRSGNYVGWG